jgi:hypothetical protein
VTRAAQDEAHRQERIIHSNAVRPKDVLDWRVETPRSRRWRSVTAVAESNQHVAATASATADLAKSTRWMAIATIVVGAVLAG